MHVKNNMLDVNMKSLHVQVNVLLNSCCSTMSILPES